MSNSNYEGTNDIGKIITQALDSEVIDKFRYSDGNISEMYIEPIILYCVIMRDSKLPEDFSLRNLSGEYLCKRIAEKLKIDEAHIDEKKDEIFNYIYNNLVEDGFCFHMTNSTTATSIQNTGLTGLSNTGVSQDISSIFSMMQKYGTSNLGLFNFSSVDIKREYGFFCAHYPNEIGRYFYSPEWLKLFCRNIEAKTFEDGTFDAFERKDYERITEGIQLFIKKYNVSEQDASSLMNFLNKYWKMFENSKPILVLIPKKALGIDNTEFKAYFEDVYPDDLEDFDIGNHGNELYFRIDKLLENYKLFCSVLDQKFSCNIEPTSLSFADLSQLMPEKARKNLQVSNNSRTFSWNNIVRSALEMGVTIEDCLAIQKAETPTILKKGEKDIDD